MRVLLNVSSAEGGGGGGGDGQQPAPPVVVALPLRVVPDDAAALRLSGRWVQSDHDGAVQLRILWPTRGRAHWSLTCEVVTAATGGGARMLPADYDDTSGEWAFTLPAVEAAPRAGDAFTVAAETLVVRAWLGRRPFGRPMELTLRKLVAPRVVRSRHERLFSLQLLAREQELIARIRRLFHCSALPRCLVSREGRISLCGCPYPHSFLQVRVTIADKHPGTIEGHSYFRWSAAPHAGGAAAAPPWLRWSGGWDADVPEEIPYDVSVLTVRVEVHPPPGSADQSPDPYGLTGADFSRLPSLTGGAGTGGATAGPLAATAGEEVWRISASHAFTGGADGGGGAAPASVAAAAAAAAGAELRVIAGVGFEWDLPLSAWQRNQQGGGGGGGGGTAATAPLEQGGELVPAAATNLPQRVRVALRICNGLSADRSAPYAIAFTRGPRPWLVRSGYGTRLSNQRALSSVPSPLVFSLGPPCQPCIHHQATL